VVVVEAPENTTIADTEAGAIRDARVRQARRRRRLAVTLASVALAGSAAALIGHLDRASSRHRDARRLAFERARQRSAVGGWHISPALEGGASGWCIREGNGGGSCATLPVQTSIPERAAGSVVARYFVPIGSVAGWTGNDHEARITALLGSAVSSVRANGRPTRLVVRAALPYELRLAQIDLQRPGGFGSPMPALLALDARGKPLGYLDLEPNGFARRVRWWQKPQRGAPGACQIRAHRLPALEPEWGHVAAAIKPYPGRIMGRAFFSCIDTEYYLHNWPLETAILLDAQSPGRPPAPIPGMTPVPRSPGLFGAPGDWHGDITAARRGNAWLVVAGGSGLTQRVQVLRHLRASVRTG
jgi:hypothetical protein